MLLLVASSITSFPMRGQDFEAKVEPLVLELYNTDNGRGLVGGGRQNHYLTPTIQTRPAVFSPPMTNEDDAGYTTGICS
jgi:hypothetical protein